jgi:CRP-like cAMP-binding protein
MINAEQSSKVAKEIKKVLDLSDEKIFQPGEIIFKEGEEDHQFYILLKGNVEISKSTSEGESKVIAEVNVGEFLGEGVLSGVVKKPATAKAIDEVVLLSLTDADFSDLTKENPQVAVHFLLSVVEAVNGRLSKTNTKLLALFEISQLLHEHRDDLEELAKGLIRKLIAITTSQEGALLLKKPFSNDYRIIHSSSEVLTLDDLEEFDLTEAQMISNEKGHWLIENLKDLGVLVLHRGRDRQPYEDDQFRLLGLIADQVANMIKEASEQASEKAREMLHQKHFQL